MAIQLYNKMIEHNSKNILVFDLETTGLDTKTCDMISFHAYSYTTKQYYNLLYKQYRDKIKFLLDTHDVYVTYNGDSFDFLILERLYNTRFNNRTTSLDLLKILIKRGTLMKFGGFKSYSLYNISRELDLKHKKGEFNFEEDIDIYDQDKLKELFIYAEQDIKATKDLLEYLMKYFNFYKDYLKDKDIISWSWLKSSPGTYAYKAICNLSNIPELWPTYDDKNKTQNITFKGGYVSDPSKELETGNIYCLDFNSAYPHAYIMLNLFGHDCPCCSEEEKYSGKNGLKLDGRYCSKQLSDVSKTIKKLYDLRLKYKKDKDPREISVKIILNTLYGICGNPTFKSVFNINTASDCTKFCRFSIKLARDMFKDSGYDIIYSDTDSVYLRDVYNDEEKLMKNKDNVIKEIKKTILFDTKTFDMGIDDRIKLMYFPELKKKNYLYVTKDNKIKIKKLLIKKDNSTRISKIVFEELIKDNILKGIVKLDRTDIKKLINTKLKEDLSLSSSTYNVKAYEKYDSKNGLFAQISLKYGQGRIQLIPNTANIGVGKSKRYCTIEEFKENKLTIHDIDLEKTYSELNIFSIGALHINEDNLDTWLK